MDHHFLALAAWSGQKYVIMVIMLAGETEPPKTHTLAAATARNRLPICLNVEFVFGIFHLQSSSIAGKVEVFLYQLGVMPQ